MVLRFVVAVVTLSGPQALNSSHFLLCLGWAWSARGFLAMSTPPSRLSPRESLFALSSHPCRTCSCHSVPIGLVVVGGWSVLCFSD